MIHEVDEALRRLVKMDASGIPDVEVVFEAPTRDWAARRNAPTINLYLYDIREDLKRRSRGLINEYDEDQMVVARHRPPHWIKLSYLMTAWTQRPEDEHRLLSVLLTHFLQFDSLPDQVLRGSLVEMGIPVPISTALPPPEDRSFADVWSAMGGELKPSLDVVVSAPLPNLVFAANKAAKEGLALDMSRGSDGEPVPAGANGDRPVMRRSHRKPR